VARGGLALVLRQGIVKVIHVVGTVVLARILMPEDFGVYAIVAFALAGVSLVGDLGMGAALIQQRDEPSERILRVVFTIQVAIFSTGAGLAILASPWLQGLFSLPGAAGQIIVLLALALVMSGLRTVPAVRLERHLNFTRLSIAETAQAMAFQGTAIALALVGTGVLSFGIAALAAATVHTVAVNILSPWRPGLALPRRHEVGPLLRFGVPFQGITIVSFMKDAVNPVLVGLLAGAGAVGLVNWATLVISYTLLVAVVLNRLYFPAFSRLADRPEQLARLAEAAIRWNAAISVGVAALFLAQARPLTALVFGDQWLPAIDLLPWLVVAVPLAAAAWPALALLNALGRSREAFMFATLWCVITWLVTPPAVAALGWIGFGPANLVVTLTLPLVCFRAQQLIPVRIWRAAAPAVLAGAAAWLTSSLVGGILPLPGSAAAMVATAVGGIVYTGVWWIGSGLQSRAEVLAFVRYVRAT
jgi:O-antigen/teichoic acid export membrane protein